MGGFWVKVYYAYGDYLVAVCDEELLGKEFREKEVILKVSESFYKGELADEEKVKEELKKATIGNIVGEKSVKIAKELGLIDEKGVKYIQGIPHAQFVIYFFQGT